MMVNHKKTFPTVGRVKYFDDNINLNHKIFITIDSSSQDNTYIDEYIHCIYLYRRVSLHHVDVYNREIMSIHEIG